jgi:hypothetical protein
MHARACVIVQFSSFAQPQSKCLLLSNKKRSTDTKKNSLVSEQPWSSSLRQTTRGCLLNGMTRTWGQFDELVFAGINRKRANYKFVNIVFRALLIQGVMHHCMLNVGLCKVLGRYFIHYYQILICPKTFQMKRRFLKLAPGVDLMKHFRANVMENTGGQQ